MNPETTSNEHCIEACNSLLRGEISAVETYDQTISKFSASHDCAELVRIRDEHARAVELLRTNVAQMGGTPSTESGGWGSFAKTVQGAANLFGDESALSALQQGEEHGRNEYQELLDDGNAMGECKNLVRTELLPQTERHIATLERLGA